MREAITTAWPTGPRMGREPGSTMMTSVPSSCAAEAAWPETPLPWCWAAPGRESLFPPSSFPVTRPPPSSRATPWCWRFTTPPERWSGTFPPWKALPLIPLQERRPFPWTWRILPWRGGKDTSWLPECAAARAAPPPPIRLPTSRYPMKPFRNRLPHLWECLAWEPSSSGVPGTR